MEPDRVPTVICSVLERDAAAVLARVAAAPAGCAVVEIRADHLRAADVREVVARVDRPVVVAVRAERDGGRFDGSEDERRRMLIAALDAGARWIDVEWNGPHADLAASERARNVVLSHHGADCDRLTLGPLHDEMVRTGAARLKIVPAARSVAETVAVRELLRSSRREPGRLACFAGGGAGALTRLLAPAWGSWATYGAAAIGAETAEGQFTAAELLDLYRVLDIEPSTRLFGLVGRGVRSSPSPAMHGAGYVAAGLDARYVPLECERFDDLLPWLEATDDGPRFDGLAVTIPFKRDAARRSTPSDDVSRDSGSVNTVLLRSPAWLGYNTDGPGAVEAVRRRFDPSGTRVAIVGAGGTALATACALHRAGAETTLFARDPGRARAAAASVDSPVAGLDAIGEHAWDVLVNATPLGRNGETVVSRAGLRGRLVLDFVYGLFETPLARDARATGIDVIDGYELLVEQAVGQFERMTGRAAQRELLRAACSAWLDRSRNA